ncbi:heterokaryon incompatibility protein-domain-containing protein [Dactylonectria estremocensis]|uniref:Heterokaryon incompatibility protein-domain-containing protein n=1 Tax=Dactylonectria estremocensis TaxID=1079267 RepID=A0A9P9FC25_9HYPO|nr:heterokaryon incompatibility protein-domain-containing protein [Dactylonectria estremocensis]
MRLLNTKTLELEDVGAEPGSYAIVSHTWGQDELLFADVNNPERLQGIRWKNTNGYRKVAKACETALKQGFKYVWIDSCCIDKTNSAEVSEAINSMFGWYRDASTCYAYLSDVTVRQDGALENFESSRWFTRGWTLQELIAPDDVEFFSRDWEPLGMRSHHSVRIGRITGIPEAVLTGRERSKRRRNNLAQLLYQENIATRMSWAAYRETTRREDMAYSLMGLFGVNMTILYGEGDGAFLRLQEEILKTAQDQSMLIWRSPLVAEESESKRRMHYFADSPKHFNLRTFGGQEDPNRFSMTMTVRGLEVRVWKCRCRVTYSTRNGGTEQGKEDGQWLAVLDCSLSSDTLARAAILLEASAGGGIAFRRLHPNVIMIVEPKRSGFLMADGDMPGYRCKIQSVEYDPGDLKKETIILESAQDGPLARGVFPFKLSLPPNKSSIQQRAAYTGARRYISSEHIAFVSVDNPIYGVVFLNAGRGREFLIWWGLVELGSAMSLTHDDRGAPRLWDNSIPVCFVQSWSNLTGKTDFHAELADQLAGDVLNEELRLPWSTGSTPKVVDVDDGLDLGPPARSERPMIPSSVIGLFTQRSQPVVESVCSGIKVRATMRRAEFLGRLACELEVEVVENNY